MGNVLSRLPRLSWKRILLWGGLIGLALAYLLFWLRLDRKQMLTLDFLAFYTGGKVAQQYGYAAAYHIPYQQQIQSELLGVALGEKEGLLYNHVPFLLPLLRWLAHFPFERAYWLWVAILAVVYLPGYVLFSALLPASWSKAERNFFLCSALTFLPMFVSLLQGQDTAFLFSGVVLWVWGGKRGNAFMSGLGLALTLVRPHLTLSLALPMAWSERKSFLWFVFLTSLLGVWGLALIETQGAQEYLHMLQVSASGDWFGMNEKTMPNLVGMVLNLFPTLPLAMVHGLGWGAYLTGLAFLTFLGTKALIPELSLSLGLFLMPHLHLHDLSLLLVAWALYVGRRSLSSSTALLPLIGFSLLALCVPQFVLAASSLGLVMVIGDAWKKAGAKRFGL